MARRNSPSDQIRRPVQPVTQHPWFERLARLGYASKGILYFVVGLLAAQAAFGTGGRTTDTQGALNAIVTQPFGKFLLGIITLGIIGYVLWRVVQTILDPEHNNEELNAKRIVQRIGYAFSAIAYTGLAWTAVQILLGSGSSNGNATQDWTARLLSQPFGRWLVGFGGAVAIGVGLAFLHEAYRAKFRRSFKLHEMSLREQRWATYIGKFGISARGVVFGIIGVFLIVAAIQSDASEARGLGGALATLARQPFGPWLLGSVALGLIAYSIYSLIEARYRQIVRS